MNPSNLRCLNKKCGNTVGVTLNLDDYPASIEVRCAICGPSFIFRDENGKLESSESRQKRMNKYRVCENCSKDYFESDHTETRDPKIINSMCPVCAIPLVKEKQDTNARNAKMKLNSRSPWRMGVNF